MIAGVAVTEVTLATHGPDVYNSITLCPDDNFTLVFDCIVAGSLSFQWSLVPLFGPESYGQNFPLGKLLQRQVTIILTEKKITQERVFYESQLQVSTGVLIEELNRRDSPLQVVCGTSSVPKRKFIRMSRKQ